jgi:hypothetical protein
MQLRGAHERADRQRVEGTAAAPHHTHWSANAGCMQAHHTVYQRCLPPRAHDAFAAVSCHAAWIAKIANHVKPTIKRIGTVLRVSTRFSEPYDTHILQRICHVLIGRLAAEIPMQATWSGLTANVLCVLLLLA